MAEQRDVTVPDIGDFTDIPITEVFVSVGDTVEVEAPLVEIESDKATMEVPSTVAGVVREVLVAVGDKVSMGTPLVKVEAAGNGAAPEPAAPPDEAASPSAVASAVVAEAQAQPPAGDNGGGDGAPVHASPLARRMATDLGVNLEGLQGSGPHGRITKDDVSAAASAPAAPAAPKAGERVKIFNQVTETHRVRELAELVSRLTGAEIRYYINPRNESAENELRVKNDQFLALGLNPITLNEGLLGEVIDVAAKYQERCNLSKIITNSRWRADIPWDREGKAAPAVRQTV